MSLAAQASRPLQRIDRFELRRMLDLCAQVTVYLAHDPRLDREVARKCLDADAKSVVLNQWLHEVRAADQLLTGIQDVSEAMVASDFDLNQILHMVLETMYRALGFQLVIFCLRPPRLQTLTVVGVTSLTPGTGHNGWGCFVPDLTRLAALPCGEARRGRL